MYRMNTDTDQCVKDYLIISVVDFIHIMYQQTMNVLKELLLNSSIISFSETTVDVERSIDEIDDAVFVSYTCSCDQLNDHCLFFRILCQEFMSLRWILYMQEDLFALYDFK